MANAIYPKYKEALISGGSNVNLATGTVKLILVDTGAYTYSATHEFLSDVPSGARIGISSALSSKTTTNGVFDAADASFTGLTATSVEAIITFVDTGAEGTSRLVAFQDTGITNIPFTPTAGGSATLATPDGLFAL